MRRFILTTSFSFMLIGAFWLCAIMADSIAFEPDTRVMYLSNDVEDIVIEPDLVPLGINVNDTSNEFIEDDTLPESNGNNTDDEINNEITFTDIDSHWAKEYITQIVAKGIMSGTTQTTFSPNDKITKAMFITTLGRIRNNVEDKNNSKFNDIPKDVYYLKYVNWADENGLLFSSRDNKFNPNSYITREEIAFAVSNYLQNIEEFLIIRGTAYDDEKDFSKETIDSIYFLKGIDMMFAKQDNKFMPKETMSRAECAALMYRLIEKLQIN